MPKGYPKILLGAFVLVTFALILFYKTPGQVQSAATHVVISEIQIEGGTADDEFVELYNPTGLAVDMEGWRLRRTSASGSTGMITIPGMTQMFPRRGLPC